MERKLQEPRLVLARRRLDAQVLIGAGPRPPACGRAAYETELEQKRLHRILEGFALLVERGRQRLDPDRAAFIVGEDRLQVASIQPV